MDLCQKKEEGGRDILIKVWWFEGKVWLLMVNNHYVIVS